MKQKKMVRSAMSTLLMFGAFFVLFGALSCQSPKSPSDNKKTGDEKEDAIVTKVTVLDKTITVTAGKPIKVTLDVAPTADIAAGNVKVKAKGKKVAEMDMTVTKVEKKSESDSLKPTAGQATHLKVTATDPTNKLKDAMFELTVEVQGNVTPSTKEPSEVTSVTLLGKTWTGPVSSTNPLKIILDSAPNSDITKENITEIKAKSTKAGSSITDITMTVKTVTKKAGESLKPAVGKPVTITVVAEDQNNPSKLNDVTFDLVVEVKAQQSQEKEDGEVTSVTLLGKTWTGPVSSTNPLKIILDSAPNSDITKENITEIKAKSTKAGSSITDITMTVKTVTKKAGESLKPAVGKPVTITVVAEDQNNPSKLNDVTFDLVVEVKAAPPLTEYKFKSLKITNVAGTTDLLDLTSNIDALIARSGYSVSTLTATQLADAKLVWEDMDGVTPDGVTVQVTKKGGTSNPEVGTESADVKADRAYTISPLTKEDSAVYIAIKVTKTGYKETKYFLKLQINN